MVAEGAPGSPDVRVVVRQCALLRGVIPVLSKPHSEGQMAVDGTLTSWALGVVRPLPPHPPSPVDQCICRHSCLSISRLPHCFAAPRALLHGPRHRPPVVAKLFFRCSFDVFGRVCEGLQTSGVGLAYWVIFESPQTTQSHPAPRTV